jgi:catechol 2,3-dioxygenase-like lactoylglutathione lyase family enzyme
MDLPLLHHVTLTVTDPDRSAAFYQGLFGPAEIAERHGEGWRRLRLLWPNGLVLGMSTFGTTSSDDRFDPSRVGLDHVGFGVADEAAVQHWAAHMDGLGIPRGPIEDVPYAVAVTGRDPDDLPIEFYWMRIT